MASASRRLSYGGQMAGDALSTIHLRRSDQRVAEVEAAVERFGRRVGLAAVADDLDRWARRTPVPGLAVDQGFRWDDPDVQNQRWWPQGLTSSADADPSETVGGRRLLLVSWYSKELGGQNHGSRVTVVDLETLRYRHVLLVRAHRHLVGGVRLEPLRVHAGGLLWCGPYLHVAATAQGLVSCLLDDVVEMRSTEHSLGYRFVLPVRFGYDAGTAQQTEPMRYSFLSLDRSVDPPEVVAGEYGRGSMTRRLVRYALDPDTLHLSADEHGRSYPLGLELRGIGHMQGAARVGGTYYVTYSRGPHLLGRMYVGQPGAFRTNPRSLPPGPEDLSYWPSTDRLWSVSEWPGRRFVYSVPRSAVHR